MSSTAVFVMLLLSMSFQNLLSNSNDSGSKRCKDNSNSNSNRTTAVNQSQSCWFGENHFGFDGWSLLESGCNWAGVFVAQFFGTPCVVWNLSQVLLFLLLAVCSGNQQQPLSIRVATQSSRWEKNRKLSSGQWH